MEVAERINQLGGKPDFNPAGLAERIAVEHHRELTRYFGERDPSTRLMLQK